MTYELYVREKQHLAQLAAAQAEIALQDAENLARHEECAALENKLSAAQAEIERLQKQSGVYRDAYNETQTKLSNLRTAATRYLHGEITRGEWLLAIEASK